jgi:hypothetical protein
LPHRPCGLACGAAKGKARLGIQRPSCSAAATLHSQLCRDVAELFSAELLSATAEQPCLQDVAAGRGVTAQQGYVALLALSAVQRADWLGHLMVSFLCELPAARQRSSSTVAPLLQAAVLQLPLCKVSGCVAFMCALPAAAQLSRNVAVGWRDAAAAARACSYSPKQTAVADCTAADGCGS